MIHTSQESINNTAERYQRIKNASNMALQQGWAGEPLSGLALDVSNEIDAAAPSTRLNPVRNAYEQRSAGRINRLSSQ